MVCLVCTRSRLPHADEIVQQLCRRFDAIRTILINVNREKTNVILGLENQILYGPGFIEDTLCGVPVQLGPLSFYQVNTPGAEQLYRVAAEYAASSSDDLLLDLYCGMGTIGLSMVQRCRELIGVEIIPEAIESAKANAARMGAEVAAKSRFFCADAGEAASRLASEGLAPDIVVVDPPRKGCDQATLSAIVKMAPCRLVYVSCNPATAARDCAILQQSGYSVDKVQPVDMFPRTGHVETVVLLGRKFEKSREHVYLDYEPSAEIDLPGGATYSEIKQWIQAEYDLNVSSLYVAQVKQKHGIVERECYNKPKSENAKQPKCPPEKEAAIEAALKHFKMI